MQTTFERSAAALDATASMMLARNNPKELPKTGEPVSTAWEYNKDGSVKRERTYGPDGRAIRDRDFNHSDDGTHEFPHDHTGGIGVTLLTREEILCPQQTKKNIAIRKWRQKQCHRYTITILIHMRLILKTKYSL